MNNESQIIEELKQAIHQLIPIDQIKFDFYFEQASLLSAHSDVVIAVSMGTLRFKLFVEVSGHDSLPLLTKKIARLKSACRNDEIIPVILTRYLSPKRQSICQKEGVFFIDLSGNVYLRYQSFYVERVGFPNKFPEIRTGRNPFSDKASLILRAMLQDAARHWGIREMAEKTHLNPGYVSRMAEELLKRKYILRQNNKLCLRSPEGILDDWVRRYEVKKNKSVKYFCMAASSAEILDKIKKLKIPKDITYALSVQAGASLISPYAVFKEVHLYVQHQKDIQFFEKHMQLNATDQGANLILLLPYYKHSVFFGSRWVQDCCVASDVQLYLDLYNYPIRGREQAEHLYNKQLQSLWNQVSNP